MHRRRQKVRRWVKDLLPHPIEVAARERWRVALLAGFALMLVALFWRVLSWWLDWHGERLGLLAPLGASALLVFSVPASPMAQPWPTVVGNSLSVIVGLMSAHVLQIPELAAMAAVSGSIAIMYWTRSLHPPGVAMSLLMVLIGSHADPWPLLFSGFGGSLLLVVAGCFFNPWTGKRYPVRLPNH